LVPSHGYCASHARTMSLLCFLHLLRFARTDHSFLFWTLCHNTVQVWLYMFIFLVILYIVYKPRTYRYSTPDLFWSFSPAALFSLPCSSESDLKALSPKVAGTYCSYSSQSGRCS